MAFADAVADQTMWCYMAMLRILLAILLHLTYWVQGCPCHLNKDSYNENIYGFLAGMCLCNDGGADRRLPSWRRRGRTRRWQRCWRRPCKRCKGVPYINFAKHKN